MYHECMSVSSDSKTQQGSSFPSPTSTPSTQFQIFTDSLPSLEETSSSSDLRSFLWDHTSMVLDGKGFDEGLGRGSSSSQLEVSFEIEPVELIIL